MEDEIKVGEYVRTPLQGIYIISHINLNFDDSDYKKVCLCQNAKVGFTSINETKKWKHSKNIIDLIEDEDIVILEYKTPKYRERIERKFIVCKIDDFINFENRNCNFTYKVGDKKIVDKICKNIKIKGILTTEQFNNEYYRLEK